MDNLSEPGFNVSESSIIEISGTVVALKMGKNKLFMKMAITKYTIGFFTIFFSCSMYFIRFYVP